MSYPARAEGLVNVYIYIYITKWIGPQVNLVFQIFIFYNCALYVFTVWQLNCVLMLNWIVLNRTDYLHKNGFGVK